MGAQGEYQKLTCKVEDNGEVTAASIVNPAAGGEIATITTGKPESFQGISVFTNSDGKQLFAPVDSKNINSGENSLVGLAAKIGKQDIVSCNKKLGPAI